MAAYPRQALLLAEVEEIQRGFRHLYADLASIHELAPIRLAHLTRQLKATCEAAILRARNGTISTHALHRVTT